MTVEALLRRANEGLSAGRAFGPAIEADGCLIVPVAVAVGGGGGGDAPGEAGVSTGGGFGTISFPLGVYVVKDGNARWVPAVDMTRVALGAMGVVRALLRLRSRRSGR